MAALVTRVGRDDRPADPVFMEEYREHVERSVGFGLRGRTFVACGCVLALPGPDCDVGTALWKVAHQPNRERITSAR